MANRMEIKKESMGDSKIINFVTAKARLEAATEQNIVDIHAFRECLYHPEIIEWEGRALALLSDISSCLFWEEAYLNRKDLDEGRSGYFSYKYEMLLATYSQEQCKMKCHLYLSKAVRAGCALNAELRNHTGRYFIKRKLRTTDEPAPYNYDLMDSLKFVHDFAEAFDDKWGGEGAMREMRWDLKLKEYNNRIKSAA